MVVFIKMNVYTNSLGGDENLMAYVSDPNTFPLHSSFDGSSSGTTTNQTFTTLHKQLERDWNEEFQVFFTSIDLNEFIK